MGETLSTKILSKIGFVFTQRGARLRSLLIIDIALMVESLGSSIVYTGVYPYLMQVGKIINLSHFYSCHTYIFNLNLYFSLMTQ